jgi:integrase
MSIYKPPVVKRPIKLHNNGSTKIVYRTIKNIHRLFQMIPFFADRLMREALQRVGLEERGMSTHSFRRTCLTAMSGMARLKT